RFQVKEVLDFSLAILPSVILSAIMHTLSLVPTLLMINGVISYAVCSVLYYSIHSLNCIVTKLTLIICHKGMRQRFQLLIFRKVRNSKTKRIKIDVEREGNQYFEKM
ncbi:hypothetical protein PMAYCL1PPCAC_28010, partial [Pristionchus mayeri]